MGDISVEDSLESLIRAAVIENSLRELDSYPDEAELDKLVISERCDRRIKRTVKNLRFKEAVFKSLRCAGRTAAILVVLFAGCFAFLMQFEEVRAACHDAVVEIFERYFEYDFKLDENDNDAELELGYVPAGYYKIKDSENKFSSAVKYTNDIGDVLLLQRATSTKRFQFDNENYEVTDIEISGEAGKFLSAKNKRFSNYIIWNSDKYSYTLEARLEKDEMKKIAENIK